MCQHNMANSPHTTATAERFVQAKECWVCCSSVCIFYYERLADSSSSSFHVIKSSCLHRPCVLGASTSERREHFVIISIFTRHHRLVYVAVYPILWILVKKHVGQSHAVLVCLCSHCESSGQTHYQCFRSNCATVIITARGVRLCFFPQTSPCLCCRLPSCLPAVGSWCWWQGPGTWSSRARSSRSLSRWSSGWGRVDGCSAQSRHSGRGSTARPAGHEEINTSKRFLILFSTAVYLLKLFEII